jgi:hypothetical protein
MKHLKTLVVHPADPTTDFLKPIYAGIPNCTVVTSGTIWELDLQIEDADRIICLGHGTGRGLLSMGQFKGGFYCVDEQSAQLMKSKKNCVFIFCYASDFVKDNDLRDCFATGMFISEKREADYCGVKDQLEEDVQIQNDYFTKLVRAGINLPSRQLYKMVSREFAEVALHCPVARYNHDRLHVA